MGRIVANVRIRNLLEPETVLECDALVDTGSGYLALPMRCLPIPENSRGNEAMRHLSKALNAVRNWAQPGLQGKNFSVPQLASAVDRL